MAENETKLLQAVSSQSGGRDIQELINMTGLTYEEIERAYISLSGRLIALRFQDKYIKRIFLSKYEG